MRHEPLHDRRLPVQRGAQLLAHSAATSVATDKILASHCLQLPVGLTPQRDGHAVISKFVGLESHTPVGIDQRLGKNRVLQHRLNLDLRDTHWGLGRESAIIDLRNAATPLCHARVAKAMQLMTCHARHPRDIEIVVDINRHLTKCVRETKLRKQLHAAPVGDIHLRVPRGCLIALHKHACNAETRKGQGKCHAHRATARNQYRSRFHGTRRLHRDRCSHSACRIFKIIRPQERWRH
ncbi:hypothetical protein D3C72_1083820 [compost metagenome]